MEQLGIAVTLLSAIQGILAWVLRTYIHEQLTSMKLELIEHLQDTYASKERVQALERRLEILEQKC